MDKGRVLSLVFALLLPALLIPAPATAAGPEVTIIPDNRIVSVNSPFLMRVDPGTTERPMRITWSVYNTGSVGIGSFPIIDGEGLCYFSGSDTNATCGPSPFTVAGETELYVYVVTPTAVLNKTIAVNVSGVEISTEDVSQTDNKVYMYFYGKRDWMKYSIYKEDLSIYQTERPLEYNTTVGRYEGSIQLNPGVYYFSFMANDTGTYGVAMKRIYIESGNFLNIDTDREEYWTGEKIRITGTTNAEEVSGSVYFPSSGKAKDFSIDVSGDQGFSYEFSSRSDWPEGEYEIRTTEPTVKSVNFRISEFFELSPESVSESVEIGESFGYSIEARNIRGNATNVSIEGSGEIEDSYLDIDVEELSTDESAYISINIPSVTSAIDGSVVLTAGVGVEMEIPVSISVTGGEGYGNGTAASDVIEIDKDYLLWSEECIAGEETYYEVALTNTGDQAISGLTYSVDDLGYENSLESMESQGYVEFPVQDVYVSPGETNYLTMYVTPMNTGSYKGAVTLRSGGSSAFFVIDLRCYGNISGDIEALESRLGGIPESDAKLGIEDTVSDARDAYSMGSYELAKNYYEAANAKLDLMEEGGTGGGGVDFTLIIIIVIIIVAAVAILWFFKFRGPSVSSEASEEEDLEGF